MAQGKVKFFDKKKGFGFINRPNQPDLYFNKHSLVNQNTYPNSGDTVSYSVETGIIGSENQAANVAIEKRVAKSHSKTTYYGKPQYRRDTRTVPSLSVRAGMAFFEDRPGWAILGAIAGECIERKLGGGTRFVEGEVIRTTPTKKCKRCGGDGHPTGNGGYQCEDCKRFWV
ncbi:cold shock domain-containing protein [Pseudoalteromonas sp. L23]|uniref:cold-shock protein n=1 Tax=unclassified Pseudoalteromonas TaxID=194690 RepID=UPI001EF0EDBE|nr:MULTISPECIES: cold shock domain-containing protein [unclassified Pseudoalteromonas]MCF7516495.1 cold shock domain-containing protein [Pseudoalteromonas sp. L7]MCF7528532.1 cold shock domain-containing protein [Pseudoalteromonas sp. L23]